MHRPSGLGTLWAPLRRAAPHLQGGFHMQTRNSRAALAVGAIILTALVAPAAAQQPSSPPPPPRLVLALEAHVQLGTPIEVGQVPRGRRRVIPIVGGTFQGSGIKGNVLNN